MSTALQTVHLAGKDFVILEKRHYERLAESRSSSGVDVTDDVPWPPLPAKLPSGNYPAAEALGADLGRHMIKRRWAAQLSQAELARRAGVRAETLNRLERGKLIPAVMTINKLVAALKKAERATRV